MDAQIDKLEKVILSAIEKSKQPAPPEKVREVTGQEEQYPYYGPPGDAEYTTQVNAAGSWNPNGSWNPGRQRDAPWREHPNFRWEEGNQNQPNPPQNTYNGPSSHGAHPNWSGRNQQNQNQPNHNPNSAYVPPHQRGYQNNKNSQPPHYQNRPNNQNTQNQHQWGSSNQPPQYQGSYSNQPFSYQNNSKFKHVEELVGDVLNSQQHMQSNLQANNECVHRMQDAQKEQKAGMDMLARKLSQIATSLNEMRGNEVKIPSSVKIHDKANVSQIILRSGKEYKEPEIKVFQGESSGKMDVGDKLTKWNGHEDERNIDHIEESSRPLPKETGPFFLEKGPGLEEDPKQKSVQKKD